MRAEILSTGDEVRSGAIVDTNAAFIADALESLGINVCRHTTVGDDVELIAETLQTIATRADIALITGGLGPTVDDVTAEAAARAAGTRLAEMPAALTQVEGYFRSRGLEMTLANRKQALLPEHAEVLENPDGSAPGFRVEIGACRLYFLPGVPREMKPMLARHVLPDIQHLRGAEDELHQVAVVTTFGLTESAVDEMLQDLTLKDDRLRIGLRVLFPEIHIRLYGRGDRPEIMAKSFEDLKDAIRKHLGQRVLSTEGESLPEVLGKMLIKHRATLALAESCTGGLIAKQLTDVPGSSSFFLMSAVTYANEAKTAVLGVAPETLQRYGAVHEKTAREMAEGARRVACADFALSTTGIAGPDGGTDEKPVGTICIGLATPEETLSFRYTFPFGDRDLNRRIFTAMALDRLRQYLMRRHSKKESAE